MIKQLKLEILNSIKVYVKENELNKKQKNNAKDDE